MQRFFLFIGSAFISHATIKLDVNHKSSTSDTTQLVKAWDVVINEIMVDPDPAAELLLYSEYVELYNKKSLPVQLKNWKFCVGAICKTLPDIVIPADSFMVLTSPAAASIFPDEVNVTGVTGFPTLSNSGQTLQLQNDIGNTISVVSYTDEWYQDAVKKEGGYSLEQMDPMNPCAEIVNWRASVNRSGGSPGKKNSIATINPDTQPPEILRVNVIASDRLEIYFTEALDTTTLAEPSFYHISSIGNPLKIDLVKPDYKRVYLTLGTHLKESIQYVLTVSEQVNDCVGNAMEKNSTARFALPLQAVAKDVVINEVLFDPLQGGVDFVEIVNRSQKVVDLKTMVLCHYDALNGNVSEMEKITTAGYLLFPGEYLVLTEDPDAVKKQYVTTNPKAFLRMEDVPPLHADKGTICLKTATEIIDNLTYDANMHVGLLHDTKGISLERVNYERPTDDVTNWHSAASSVGFATPGIQNSQYMDAVVTADPVKLVPEIFSPNEDGFNDMVTINYHFDEPAWNATIIIYDSKGRLVKTLVNNELMGASGMYSWDGMNDNREKERTGVYIIYVEVVDLSGRMKRYKKVCVLAGKK